MNGNGNGNGDTAFHRDVLCPPWRHRFGAERCRPYSWQVRRPLNAVPWVETQTLVEKWILLRSVEGIFHDGKIELVEPAPDGAEGRVIVTFLSLADADLGKR